MESISQILRFGTDAPKLGAPILLAIAVASAIGVAFLVWLVRGDGEPAGMEFLAPPIACLLAASGIWFGGSWNDVVVDATTRQVTQRHGFLGYPIGFLGKQLPFEQISGVMVERKISKHTEAKGTSMSPGTRDVYRTTYAVSLLTGETRVQLPDRVLSTPKLPIALPTLEDSDHLPMEAAARQLARLGGWPALRRHYALATDHATRGTKGADALKSVPAEDSPISLE